VGLVPAALAEVSRVRSEQIATEVARLEAAKLSSVLRRTEVTYASLAAQDPGRPALPEDVQAEVEVEVKYAGYVKQAQTSWVRKLDAHDGWRIPQGFSFRAVRGLGAEAMEKLERARPDTVGHARRIPGVTPAAVSLLLIALGRHADSG
jgi:tRNA uridine 5-carboxymethylaminomethyl modification enzyme